MIGAICRMDQSGLGQGQTKRLTRLLKPDKLMIIDSTRFNGNKQFPEWYKGYPSVTIGGFPSDMEVRDFLKGLEIVISCETFYNNNFTYIAKEMGVKTILIANYEFFDWHAITYRARNPTPDKILMPSYWHLEEMQRRFDAEYLPTPIFEDEFKQARKVNLKRKDQVKYLFINGKTAAHDRNGLESLYEALPLAKGDFTVTIKAQHDIKRHPDPRLIYDCSNPENQTELFTGFDALIQPRRYGGQTLSMCEALLSGLPVIMTDVDPNNKVLPAGWLIPARKTGQFMTRTMIDIYSANSLYLAKLMDAWSEGGLEPLKKQAYEIGKQFEAEALRAKYSVITQEMIQ